jgi:hypothetical protein
LKAFPFLEDKSAANHAAKVHSDLQFHPFCAVHPFCAETQNLVDSIVIMSAEKVTHETLLDWILWFPVFGVSSSWLSFQSLFCDLGTLQSLV